MKIAIKVTVKFKNPNSQTTAERSAYDLRIINGQLCTSRCYTLEGFDIDSRIILPNLVQVFSVRNWISDFLSESNINSVFCNDIDENNSLDISNLDLPLDVKIILKHGKKFSCVDPWSVWSIVAFHTIDIDIDSIRPEFPQETLQDDDDPLPVKKKGRRRSTLPATAAALNPSADASGPAEPPDPQNAHCTPAPSDHSASNPHTESLVGRWRPSWKRSPVNL